MTTADPPAEADARRTRVKRVRTCLHVELPPDLILSVKVSAAETGRTMCSLVQEALRAAGY
jgi:hypothetical protein